MASNMSSADQQLTKEQQAQIQALKEAYAQAQAAGDQAGMDSAHTQAEAIRSSAGYSGGADGSSYVPLSNQNPNGGQYQSGGVQSQTAGSRTGGSYGDNSLSAEQQAQIQALKEAWAAANAAGDQAAMNQAHAQAEAIRNSAGFSGGSDGSGYTPVNSNGGGASAADVQRWLDDYWYTNYDSRNGWVNGFSSEMNLRSMANYIRQQMEANSKAWAGADQQTRAYLHDQNLQLAKILEDAVGGATSTFNENLGRWETGNANLGYGYNVGQYLDEDWYRNQYRMTDEQMDAYRNDTDRYRNYVDQGVIRNWVDDSSGYTGVYSQFVNGPYSQLLYGSKSSIVNPAVYKDLIGDGFNEQDYTAPVDANGNIVPQAPALKNNNPMTDYTRQFTSYVDENGVIQPGQYLQLNPAGNARPADERAGNGVYSGNAPSEGYVLGSGEPKGYIDINNVSGGIGTSGDGSSSWRQSASRGSASGTGSDLSGYINQMYDANLQSQLAQLEAAYQTNLADLDKSQAETDAAYNEQKRQAQGDAERSAANWRELALAQGLNTGTVGQAALAQNNQLQSNLNTLGAAQAKELANIQNQRTLLGQQYQLQILQAQADNDMQRAQMLYQEAVRADEALREQEAQAMNMMQTLLGYAVSGSGSSGSDMGGSYGGSTGGSGGSSGSSVGVLPVTSDSAALGSDAFYQNIREQANKNGQSAIDYIYSNYKALGIPYSQLGKYASAFSAWDDSNSMSDSEFTMYLYTLQHLARANQTERVYSQIEQNMNNLSASQQAQVEDFLNKWGKG